jgi:hypothetical protein
LLKLDTTRLLEQLGKELAESGQVDPSFSPTSRGIVDTVMFHMSRFSRRLVWPAVGTAAVVLVAVVGYLVWNHIQHEDPTAGIGEGRYQAPPNSGDTLPVPAAR